LGVAEVKAMSGNPYVDCQKFLKDAMERYEEMYAQFAALREVIKNENVKLIIEFDAVLTRIRPEVAEEFRPLFDEISLLSPETQVSQLISKIPKIPV
jgi:hypothetical protein